MREDEIISDTTCEKYLKMYLKMHHKSWQCKPNRKQREKNSDSLTRAQEKNH